MNTQKTKNPLDLGVKWHYPGVRRLGEPRVMNSKDINPEGVRRNTVLSNTDKQFHQIAVIIPNKPEGKLWQSLFYGAFYWFYAGRWHCWR